MIITEKLAHLKLLLASMNVPEYYKDQTGDLTVADLRWLDRNLYMRNAEHPLYRETSIHIEQMLAEYGVKSLKLGRT